MTLTSGTKLGPYEIQSKLGAGGMGEVYRARDTRLERVIAIKVLPTHLSSSPALKQRMEREAKAISSLNHPNICHFYDIGSQDGTEFLVMECLEGQTLAERLQKGCLPVGQVLRIGTEIAQALEKAHQQGIIHRDLKPANIMLTKEGSKLMDFGLAKPKLPISTQAVATFTPSTPTMDLASLTSSASPLTQKGSIVGTFQYMAPEVLQGAEADARSDLFSFGCVLYEMVTGRHAFEGKSQLSVLTAILEKEPEPVRIAQPLTPPMLDRVIRACLAKDPAERMQTAHDLAMNLQWTADVAPDASKSSPTINKGRALVLGALLLALIVLAGFLGDRWAKSSSVPVSLHSEIPAPEKFLFDATGDAGGMPVLSPQGDKLALVAHSTESKMLWVRSLSNDFATSLDGTLGAAHPFWSPDGRYIAFFARGKLMKIPADGGPIVTLADAPNPRGGTWGVSDVIVFEGDYLGGLMKVSANGGPTESATVLDRTEHSTHRWPWFLPDGKHFLYLATNHSGGDAKQNGIYLGSVDKKEVRLIVNTESSAEYASGYLLYRLNTALVAQPFDPQSDTLSGSPIALVNNLRDDVGVWRSIFSVSQNGLMTYQIGNASSVQSRLMWFDRAGKSTPECEAEEKGIIDLRLSPDNKQAVYAGATAIWTCDLERNTKTRVTFDNQPLQQPSWSPDGKVLMLLCRWRKAGGTLTFARKPPTVPGTKRPCSTIITITTQHGRLTENISAICGAMARSRFLSGLFPSPAMQSPWPSCSLLRRRRISSIIEFPPMGSGWPTPLTKLGNPRFTSRVFRRERANGGCPPLVRAFLHGAETEKNCFTKISQTISTCAQLVPKDLQSSSADLSICSTPVPPESEYRLTFLRTESAFLSTMPMKKCRLRSIWLRTGPQS
jgi:eukaryotic-like serine/threonine-protein kinase